MKSEYRCPNCFQGDIGTGRCTRCGFRRQEEKQNPMRLPEMSFLGNRYLIGRILGNGGFGITYKAFDVLNQCICAVKEFVPVGVVARQGDGVQVTVTSKSNLEDFEHGKRRFMEEAEVLKKLTDVPEVVQIMDYFMLNNTAYFVMEYIEGATLKQLMRSYGGRIPLPNAMSMIYRAGMALEQVHRRAGIFHRDVSPDNIMVTADNRVKLIDFGNAKHIIGKRSQTLSVILKHGYAPPEQYSSTSSQGSYTDVYSLAVTFYYVATGIMVPPAPDRFGGEEYRPLLEVCPQAGSQISEAVDRALALNSKNRTSSAAEFAYAFYPQLGKAAAYPNGTSGGTLALNGQTAPTAPCISLKGSNGAAGHFKVSEHAAPYQNFADSGRMPAQGGQAAPSQGFADSGRMPAQGGQAGTVKAYLKLAGMGGGPVWSLPDNQQVMVGRSSGWADIVPTNNQQVSKQHCKLFWDSAEKRFYLTDCSSNGTFIGNERLKKGETYILPNGGQFSLVNHICDLEVRWENG